MKVATDTPKEYKRLQKNIMMISVMIEITKDKDDKTS